MSGKTWAIITVVIIAILLVLWITQRSTDLSGQIEVFVGAILPLTGGGAEFGKDELYGAQIAIDRINAGEAHVELVLLVEDSRTQPRDGISAYKKLMASSNKPSAIITVMSSVSSALAPLAERDGIPLFCVAAAPELTKDREYVFRSLPASDYQAEVLLKLSKLYLQYTNAAILYVTDDFGTSMQSAFASTGAEVGVEIVGSEGVPTDATDFRASLTKLINYQPEAIYIAAFGSVLGSAVRQLRDLGYEGILLTTLEIGYPKVLEVAGKAAEGAIFVDTKFNAEASDAVTVKFVEEFEQRAGRKPSLDAVLAYDEIQMIYMAGQNRGFDSSALKQGLLEIDHYESMNGMASILPSGDVAYELVLKTIKNGKPERIGE